MVIAMMDLSYIHRLPARTPALLCLGNRVAPIAAPAACPDLPHRIDAPCPGRWPAAPGGSLLGGFDALRHRCARWLFRTTRCGMFISLVLISTRSGGNLSAFVHEGEKSRARSAAGLPVEMAANPATYCGMFPRVLV
jgi:hypothetical protein